MITNEQIDFLYTAVTSDVAKIMASLLPFMAIVIWAAYFIWRPSTYIDTRNKGSKKSDEKALGMIAWMLPVFLYSTGQVLDYGVRNDDDFGYVFAFVLFGLTFYCWYWMIYKEGYKKIGSLLFGLALRTAMAKSSRSAPPTKTNEKAVDSEKTILTKWVSPTPKIANLSKPYQK